MSHRFAVVLVVEMDDPAVALERVEAAQQDEAASCAIRDTVLASLPESILFLRAMLPEERAEELLWLHGQIGDVAIDEVGVLCLTADDERPTEH